VKRNVFNCRALINGGFRFQYPAVILASVKEPTSDYKMILFSCKLFNKCMHFFEDKNLKFSEHGKFLY